MAGAGWQEQREALRRWATAVVGVVRDGTKHVLGLWPGCTADAVVAREVVDGLAGRGQRKGGSEGREGAPQNRLSPGGDVGKPTTGEARSC